MQWLQYHCAQEADRIVGDMGMVYSELTTEKPPDVKLPTFKQKEPLFAKWSTPMVEAGYLWISFDRTYESGQWDRLFIDSNGNGHLDDETVIKAFRTDQRYAYFGPVKILFQGEDGPLTYHLNLRLYIRDNYKRLYIYSGGWYEGNIEVAGTKKYCVLIDQNANGTFNDKSHEAYKSDRIRIGKKGSRDTRFVGNLIEIDDELYQPEIAKDGAFVILNKAEDVKSGNIRISPKITEFSAGGENGLLKVKLKNGTGSLPVGKYRVNQWIIEKEDEKNRKWMLKGNSFSKQGDFEIKSDKEIELSVGEPIVTTLDIHEEDSRYSFRQTLKGRMGERIELTCNNTRPSPPKLRIKNKDGTYERTYNFRYG
jgi:hypothetical protein